MKKLINQLNELISSDITDQPAYFVDAIKAAKPSGAKGVYMQRMTVSSSMGPGIKVDLTGL